MNVGEGIVVAVVLCLLRMPNPALWGALVACWSSFHISARVTIVMVLDVAALTTFDDGDPRAAHPGSVPRDQPVQANVVTPLLLAGG